MLAKVDSCSVSGIDGFIVEVEIDISYGLPVFNIVGLPEVSIRESKDRVKTAIKNSGYAFPMDRVVVNLAPADIRKDGTGFDLPIAVGILAASEVIPPDKVNAYLVSGELSLDGKVKPVKAVLSHALAAKENGYQGIIIPFENAREAAMVPGIDVLPVKSLSQIVGFFSGVAGIEAVRMDAVPRPDSNDHVCEMDFSDVRGQFHVKRALEVAAAGSHSVMMTGPPGSGKSMLAKRLPSVLPELTFDEAVEVTRIYSVQGLIEDKKPDMRLRPFRSPHHTISEAGLVGGGSKPAPGEISLAHNGVLFLDELPEFKKNVLEVLRQPLEDGQVTIARAGSKVTYPSRFMLVAAMNPCPCGYLSDPTGKCTCTQHQIQKYRSKISGPLLDRIDIQIEVPAVPYKDLVNFTGAESSAKIRERVVAAREIQIHRFKTAKIFCNGQMENRHIRRYCRIDDQCGHLLENAIEKFGLSARTYNRVLKLARTIADLDAAADIGVAHMAEAIQYRSLDRKKVTAF